MLLAHPRASREPARVRLVDFASSSIQVEIFAYVTTSDWNEFLGVQEELLLCIRDMVTEIAGGFDGRPASGHEGAIVVSAWRDL